MKLCVIGLNTTNCVQIARPNKVAYSVSKVILKSFLKYYFSDHLTIYIYGLMVIETQIYEHTPKKKVQLLRQHHGNIGCKSLTARVCLLHDNAWSYTATTHLTQEKLNTITNTKVNLFCLHPFYNFFWNYPLWGLLKKIWIQYLKFKKS